MRAPLVVLLLGAQFGCATRDAPQGAVATDAGPASVVSGPPTPSATKATPSAKDAAVDGASRLAADASPESKAEAGANPPEAPAAWAAMCGFRERGFQTTLDSNGKAQPLYFDAPGHGVPVLDGAAADAGCRGRCAPGRSLVVLHDGERDSYQGFAIAGDATHVYWTSDFVTKWYPGIDETPKGELWMAPKAGGKERRLAQTHGGLYLAADSRGAYLRDHDHALRFSPDGGAPVPLAAGEANPFDDTFHDDQDRYIVRPSANYLSAIVRQPLAGGAAVTLAAEEPDDSRILGVDDTRVYWIGSKLHDPLSARRVMSVPKGGGDVVVVSTWPSCLHSTVLDGESLYFATGACGDGVASSESNSGEVLTAPLRGGAVTTLATIDVDFGTPNALLVDATRVYWVDCVGSVVSVTK
jgi:hypothetical protein